MNVLILPDLKARLFKDGNLIDDDVSCRLMIEKRSDGTHTKCGAGDFRASKPLEVNPFTVWDSSSFKIEILQDIGLNQNIFLIKMIQVDPETRTFIKFEILGT